MEACLVLRHELREVIGRLDQPMVATVNAGIRSTKILLSLNNLAKTLTLSERFRGRPHGEIFSPIAKSRGYEHTRSHVG